MIRCSYHFKTHKTTVKFISSKFSEQDFNEILINDETKRRSVEKMQKIKDKDLENGDKFYILHRLISYIKDIFYEIKKLG